MCSRNDCGGSSSISHANGVGRRRRRRGGRRSLTKNSQGSSPTWPSIGGGAAGGARPARHPVLLFPERPGLAHGLAPSPFPSRPALPLQAQEEEGRVVERRPSPPPLKDRDFLSP